MLPSSKLNPLGKTASTCTVGLLHTFYCTSRTYSFAFKQKVRNLLLYLFHCLCCLIVCQCNHSHCKLHFPSLNPESNPWFNNLGIELCQCASYWKSVSVTTLEFLYFWNVFSNPIYLRCNTILTESSKSIQKGRNT